ncbi:ABC transporter permease [Chloroflexota bacterium]
MFSFKIALRFLTAGRLQTVLVIIGMSIAISVQVFVGLLIDSLQISLVDSTIGNSPHITITAADELSTISRWDTTVREIENNNKVKDIAVSATSSAFARKGSEIVPVIVRGFDFNDADSIYGFGEAIYDGVPYMSRGEIIVGSALREKLELNLEDRLTLRTSSGEESKFKITGFYNLGVASIDKSWVLTRLETAQDIFGFGNRINTIEITLTDLFAADSIAGKVEKMLNDDDIEIENWKDTNAQLLSGLEGQRISSLVIQLVIVVSVIVAIGNVLAITVLQKSKQIGILKAIGIKDRTASMIFVYQSLLIGLAGSLLGIILGLGLLYAFIIFTPTADGSPLIDIIIDPAFIIRSWIIALLATVLAGIIPARRTLKLDPVDVIREG